MIAIGRQGGAGEARRPGAIGLHGDGFGAGADGDGDAFAGDAGACYLDRGLGGVGGDGRRGSRAVDAAVRGGTATTAATTAAADKETAADQCCAGRACAAEAQKGGCEDAHAGGIILARAGEGDDGIAVAEAEIIQRAPLLAADGEGEGGDQLAVARIGEGDFRHHAIGGKVKAVGRFRRGIEPVGHGDRAAIDQFDHQIIARARVADHALRRDVERQLVAQARLNEAAFAGGCNMPICGTARCCADGEINRRTHDTTPPQPPENVPAHRS